MEVHIPDLFDLQKITDSGQCFRVAPLPGGTYRFITGDEVPYIRKTSEEVYQVSCGQDAWERIWSPYFDLSRNYRDISKAIPEEDAFLDLAARTGGGSASCVRIPGRCWSPSSSPSAKASPPSALWWNCSVSGMARKSKPPPKRFTHFPQPYK